MRMAFVAVFVVMVVTMLVFVFTSVMVVPVVFMMVLVLARRATVQSASAFFAHISLIPRR